MASESALEPFTEQYEALTGAGTLPGDALPWLKRLREEGIQRFGELGIPTPKVEVWKYTNLRALERTAFQPAAGGTATPSLDTVPSLIGEQAGHRIVFVNGRLHADLSRLDRLPDGARLTSFAKALDEDPGLLSDHVGRIAEGHDDQAMYHLNSALMQDGLVLHVRGGVKVEEPIEVVSVAAADGEPLSWHPRHLIVLDPDSEATLVENHVSLGGGATFANAVTEITVGAGARLHHYKLQDEATTAFHIHTLHGRVGENAFYDGFGLTVGGKLTRNDLHLRLEGSFSDARLNGAYLQRGKQHCDNTTLIEHCVPDTTCREVYKGALEGKGRAVFQGKLHVHPDAQRTDGHQLSQALLLSEEAEIDAKPELEIYADDVKCSHGSTAGELEKTALFYLRSRGIPYPVARRIMVESFLGGVVEEITTESLRTAFMERITNWLSQASD
ncbi:Fe-S cluster assembly protein SufD [Ferruginivarius sediminum]|uniref:Fe-S cluster assembly protein SufD n=1 Tax=Ferruginivarius sediminum TaxID=2661937 RepID=A0A369T5Z4_9PROT|nr:Fe-S cluster assembly protein SufD [Ferruginivarius sediminum]RDD60743.1 Fe-S cluster assembly protein SufD [Ferruginivarius sediminum]